jgi:rare lipoprotein A
MTFKKLHYVFSLLTILFIGLASEVSAQKTGSTTGSATWYGSQFHGRKTTSGERYNKNELTAAHKSLPFGTKVRVTNLTSKESVVVRINDRGPFGRSGHIIDLSQAAARKINVSGHTRVKLEVLNATASVDVADEDSPDEIAAPLTTPIIADSYFVIQAGSFADQSKAQVQSDKIKAFKQDLPIFLNEDTVNGKKIHRVVAGKFPDRTAAEEARAELEKNGISGLVKQIPAGS